MNFWITNITNTDIHLSDLNVTIRAKASVDLLHKQYKLTLEQINKSQSNGSISKRAGKLFKRNLPPEKVKEQIIEKSQVPLLRPRRSVLEITEKKYSELEMSDEEYANQITES